jgi:heme-binding NEAT domain protein
MADSNVADATETPPQRGNGHHSDGTSKKSSGKNTKRDNKNKNEVPIEELYDLTKPIKWVSFCVT